MLVHCDQTGFIKSRLAVDNVRHLLHIIDAAVGANALSAVLIKDPLYIYPLIGWSGHSFGLFLKLWVLVQVLYI